MAREIFEFDAQAESGLGVLRSHSGFPNFPVTPTRPLCTGSVSTRHTTPTGDLR